MEFNGGALCVSLTVLTASFLEWRGIPSLRYRGICRSFNDMVKVLRASLLYDFRMSG